MALVTGQLRSATGQPLTTPFSISLTDYGVKEGLLYLPAKVTVTPDIGGGFAVELWSNQDSDTPVLYRVDTPQGSSFFISIPSGVLGPLDIGKVVVTKSDLKHDTNILNRLAQLEARPLGGGSEGSGVVQILTFGDGLTGGFFDGSAPITVNVSTAIARVNSPTFVNPRSNLPPSSDSSDLLATTAWAGNAANLTSGVIPSGRLPSNLVAVTAQRLATPRSIFGQPFDGTADIAPLSLGAGLLAPNSSSINIDFSVLASVGDARFTNSREWVAPTVTLLEAQAGIDVNRRAWTVQRVWQAIAAWWETVQGSLARLVSPAFTGSPTAPTPPAGDYSTRLATTGWSGNAANLSQGLIPTGRIPTLNQDTTGTAATANKLSMARSILGYPFDGTADLPITPGNGLAVNTGVLGLDPAEPRLSDAREWLAPTVTQVEAESGTSITRVAWTPLRVRQAITAWWVSFENTIARLNSPAFTGTPSAPSPSTGDASTRLATTEWAGNASNLTLGVIPSTRVPTLNQSTTGNAATATRLSTVRSIALSGGAIATGVGFDGTTNITLAVSSLDATTLTGTIADARLSNNIPKLSLGVLSPPSAASQPATAANSLSGSLQYRTDLVTQKVTPAGSVVSTTGDLVYSDGQSWRRLGSEIDVTLPPLVILTGALPASIAANTFINFGLVNSAGRGGLESVYIISVYLHYSDSANLSASHWQIQGAGIITAIQWKAGGVQVPTTFRMEGHNENDFNCSARFSLENLNRNLQLSFDKALSFSVVSNSYYRVVLKRIF